MKKYSIKQVLYFALAITLLSASAAFQMQLNIGMGPWDGLGKSISSVSGLKVGNAAILMSLTCVLIQLVILKKEFRISNILTLAVGFINGKIINLFYYGVFDKMVINSYVVKFLLFILSIALIAFFVSMIQTADFINLPLEGLCETLADKGFGKFSTIRQTVDILAIISILIITFVWNVPITLREGTIISMIVFGPLLGFYIPIQQSFVEKFSIIKK
ncbi:MAG: hypothetical protein GX074_01000 [Erysipelothrix sp.]|nr:hypothetical protein [Erysipelothrix sp.]